MISALLATGSVYCLITSSSHAAMLLGLAAILAVTYEALFTEDEVR